MKKKITNNKSHYLNIIQGNDGLYVIKGGKLVKVVRILFPYGQTNFTTTGYDLKRYILEDGEIIETYE